ncbi:ImmA/IrrE family metallo-endopeptidase [Clavibacter californiensis]|uniref:ImmA/IrrE family metallo-endopeptidase n=1 Tax=Clavibacter californiensis TaxID=1401995 RepID=A0ABX9N567_9MICO|nr:ImmA/IrrE family metallo-endopeptidase [Clavibacter californiensis]RII91603.1 ImmA/IrrE family metallo-endopeptidase [Clavibacter californiensis]UKF80190.1 ImmA/IrrE family metallo-endopeptidase [Clavibacter californiensis]
MIQRTPAQDAYSTHKKFWADTGDDLDIPIDPFVIATSMGIKVYDAILGPGRSGYLDLDPSGQPVMFLNESHSLTRKRFTCAHEIGHYVDATNRGAKAGTFDRDERASTGTDPDEVYANRFAAALLMPKPALVKQRALGMSASELSNRFRVSREAMEWRLTNLGLI